MITVDFSYITERMNKKFVPLLFDRSRMEVLVGGANSSKTYSTAQKLIYLALTEKNSRWLACRKVKKNVRHSVYDFLRAVIGDWNLEGIFDYNNSECNIKCKLNGNDILGVGLDDVDKLKSIYNPTGYWLEEADQSIPKDVQQLNLRLRGKPGCLLQGILTMNPISNQHWIKTNFFDFKKPNVLLHRSNYKDNEYLPQEIIDYLESIDDPYFRKVYVEGDWGVYGNTVFSNYVIEDFDYKADDLESVSNGMDFGTVHASTYIRVGFKDDEIYIFDELYGKGWTNSDFISAVEDYYGNDSHGWPVRADSAEPDRIIEFRRNGFENIIEAKKGPGSLGYGIDYLCSKRIHIHATRCPYTAMEFQSYKRREDKDGNAMEAFVELNDDCIAATRYATEELWNSNSITIPAYYGANELGL